MSAWEKLSQSGVVEKGLVQLTLALNGINKIGADLASGNRKLDKELQVQIDHMLSSVDRIQLALVSIAQLGTLFIYKYLYIYFKESFSNLFFI